MKRSVSRRSNKTIVIEYQNLTPNRLIEFKEPKLVSGSIFFDQKLSVEWLKGKCRIYGNNFSGEFKYYVGNLPRQYWLHHRIAVAKRLLREELLAEVSLLEIALELGFRSHSAFTKAFKRIEGKTPSTFRDNDKE